MINMLNILASKLSLKIFFTLAICAVIYFLGLRAWSYVAANEPRVKSTITGLEQQNDSLKTACSNWRQYSDQMEQSITRLDSVRLEIQRENDILRTNEASFQMLIKNMRSSIQNIKKNGACFEKRKTSFGLFNREWVLVPIPCDTLLIN